MMGLTFLRTQATSSGFSPSNNVIYLLTTLLTTPLTILPTLYLKRLRMLNIDLLTVKLLKNFPFALNLL